MFKAIADTHYLMWIDAVGGYLVCLGDEIVFGPPGSPGTSDVSIMADISNRHVTLHRDGDTYLMESRRGVKVDGRPVPQVHTLADGDVIEMGGSVQMRFRQPHALSTTARLEMLSRHRTIPAADAILLMADSCVLGPGPTSHVVCRHWQHEVILFRQRDHFACRSAAALTVAGEAARIPACVPCGVQVAGDDFAFTLENLRN